jgi:putative methylase
MKTSQLKILLSKLDTFSDPDPALEQYTTPPEVAADVVRLLSLHVDGTEIIDLGAGTGILTIGAGLLGFTVRGYETDEAAVETARQNLAAVEDEYDIDVTVHQADIEAVEDTADCVLMNPPFGIQDEDTNLAFLEAGFRMADTVFALLHRTEDDPDRTRQFIKEFASNRGYDAAVLKEYSFRLPRTMAFHDREQDRIGVDLYMFETR